MTIFALVSTNLGKSRYQPSLINTLSALDHRALPTWKEDSHASMSMTLKCRHSATEPCYYACQQRHNAESRQNSICPKSYFKKTEAYRHRLVSVDASGRYTSSVCTMAESHGKAGYDNSTTHAGTGRTNKLGGGIRASLNPTKTVSNAASVSAVPCV